MMFSRFRLACSLCVSAALLAGCSSAETDKGPDAPHAGHDAAEAHEQAHSHDGWWCNEHGVPEEVCALCDSKVAADFQKKGDWCKEHDRPDSQCFVCHPELEARFAAQYEAKYGEKPQKPAG